LASHKYLPTPEWFVSSRLPMSARTGSLSTLSIHLRP